MGTEDTSTTKIGLDLDNAEFTSKMQDSLGLMEDFGSGEKLLGIVEKLGELGAIAGVVAAGYLSLKASLDMTIEAEHIDQINQTFEKLADSFGLAGKELKDGLVDATHGLITDSAAIESANKAMVKLGDNAKHIPEIMDLARRASILFGGTLTENFDQLSSALANGNVRMLKHYGIIIDTKKAEDEYAKTLGVHRDYLDETGKKQAIFNAGLAQAALKFKDINDSATPATTALERMKTSMGELWETLVKGSKASGIWKQILDDISKGADTIRSAIVGATGTDAEKAELKTQMLRKEVERLQQKIAEHPDSIFIGQYKIELEQAQKQLDALMQKEAEAGMKSHVHSWTPDKAKEAEAAREAAAQPGANIPNVDNEKLKKDLAAAKEILLKFHKERLDAEEKTNTDIENIDQEKAQRVTLIENEANAKIDKLRTDQLAHGLITQKQFADAVKDIEAKKNSDLLLLDTKLDEERIKHLKNYEEQNKHTTAGIVAGFRVAGEQARQNFTDMGKFGEKSFNAIGSNATAAFKAIGNGSKDAGGAMRGFFLGALGDIAEQQGEAMLLMGIWPPNPAAIAAGGALVALGEAMKGAGGGSSSSSSGSYSAGSAAATTSSTVTQPTPAAAPEKKTVTVQIMGHYFETDQTRTRMMDMIREAGDFTDFNLKQIGQP